MLVLLQKSETEYFCYAESLAPVRLFSVLLNVTSFGGGHEEESHDQI